MTEKFKLPFIRDRNVILSDIEYAEKLLEDDPDNENLKTNLQILEDELMFTEPDVAERILRWLKH